jgi:asparagine synthase (glutamine-hydrolysing)
MCGIAGFVFRNVRLFDRSSSVQYLHGMARRLNHRGPDGIGTWADDRAGLAHTRLAVIDISNSGIQPMHDGRGEIHVVFNGEIYNFLSLRAELIGLGHHFVSSSDTEVLIYGYKAWGTRLFTKLTGMFALAIWESCSRRLVLARDRFGEKPLYFTKTPNLFAFASEIKAITALPEVRVQPNYDAIHDYLTYGHVVNPQTAFENIQSLPAAHYMVIEDGKQPIQTMYWHLPSASEQKVGKLEELQQGIVDRLREAIKGCLISDVPLGVFLSGGVDSSAIVALMSSLSEDQIETFSSAFKNHGIDESKFSGMVAGQYSTKHKLFELDESVLYSINKLAWHYGDPFSDSSALATFALAKQARQSVKVVLTGDGADEMFLGYQRYSTFKNNLSSDSPSRSRQMNSVYGPSFNISSGNIFIDSYGYLIERFREKQKFAGYGPALLTNARHCSYDRLLPYFSCGGDPMDMASRFDVGSYLPNDILVKMDVATMAHGLESRSPFLNHDLVEYVARIPVSQRVWGNEGKALLKASLRDYLPPEVMYRSKMGFSVPVASFIRAKAAKQTAALLNCDRFADRGLMRPDYVRQLLEEHATGHEDHGTRIWSLVCLEMWFRTFIDSDGSRVLSDDENPYAEFAHNA